MTWSVWWNIALLVVFPLLASGYALWRGYKRQGYLDVLDLVIAGIGYLASMAAAYLFGKGWLWVWP
jgi:hypothetical protein